MKSRLRKHYLTGAVVAAACAMLLSGGGHGETLYAEGQIYREPMFSGTVERTLYVGETFETDKLQNRVLADDLEDGDLTYQIQEVSNDVDVNTPGEYTVSYEVTDSDGNKKSLDTKVNVVDSSTGAEKTVKRVLYTIGDASHLSNVSFGRGYGHDRQSLGIWIPKDGELQIRLVNAEEFSGKLEVTFMNQDRFTQSTGEIPATGEWVTLKNTYKVTGNNGEESIESRECVPFIRTPKNQTVQPVIEFKWTEDTKEIPYYRYKDNEEEFFAEWEESNTPYAILEGGAATFLVPIIDRDKIINFPGESNPAYRFYTIDEMLEWYQEFVDYFDKMVGLDFYAEEPYNQNVRAKFFICANEHGYGQAYYSGDHSAYNGASLDCYLSKSWLALHEFGHGYEGTLAYQEYDLVETTNNILAYYFQQTMLTEGDWGWLLGQYPGNTLKERWAKMEESAFARINGMQYFNEIVDGAHHYGVSLYMFVNLFDKIGNIEGTSVMHGMFRKIVNEERKYPATGDVIIEGIGDVGGYNLIPYFSKFYITADQQVQNKIFEKDYKILYYLKDFLPSQYEAERVRDQLGLSGVYSLVSTDELAETGYKSNVTIKFDIDDIDQIKGKVALIKNGKKVVKAALVTDESVSVELPIGAYELELPAPEDPGYNYGNEYLIARKGNVSVQVNYEGETGNPLADDKKLELRGLSDALFATISVDTSENKLRIETEEVNGPHVVFDDVYASIQVLAPDDTVLYGQNFLGTGKVIKEVMELDFPVGSKLKVHHKEPSGRLKMISKFSGEVVSGYAHTTDNVYVMTGKGLMLEQWDEEKQNDVFYSSLVEYSDYLMDSMSGADLVNSRKFHTEKDVVVLSSQLLTQEEKQEYQEKYGILLGKAEDLYYLYRKIDSSQLTGTASSVQASEGTDDKAVDGDLSTYWHSNYTGNKQPDFTTGENTDYTILLPENMDIGKLEYLPRSGGKNGVILEYDLYYSTTESEDDFEKITSSTPIWAGDGELKSVEFLAPNARRIRICAKATGGQQPNCHISAVEFYLYERCAQYMSDKEIYLSNLNRNYQEDEVTAPKSDANAMGETITLKVDGEEKTFEKGLGLQGNTVVVYDLSKHSFDSLSTLLGVEVGSESEETARVSIYGDDVLLYVSGELSAQKNACEISLDVAGIQELKIVVESSSEDLAVSLGNAKLYLGEDVTEMILQTGEVTRITANTEIYGELSSLTTWTSEDPEVASVDELGNVTALKPGKTVITGESESKRVECEITVVETEVRKVTISQRTLSLEKGQQETLLAQAYPEFADDLTIIWESVSPQVATVDSNGMVTAMAAGTTEIIASASNGIQAEIVVTVTANPEEEVQPGEGENGNTQKPDNSGSGNTQKPDENGNIQNPPTGSGNQSQTIINSGGNNQTITGSGNTNLQQSGTTMQNDSQKPQENPTQNQEENIIGKEVEYKDAVYKVLSKDTVAFVKVLGKKSTVTIPNTIIIDGVSYKVTEIQAKAFKGNLNLKKVKIGTFVTKIGDSAFEGCKKLKSVTIGKKVAEIGKKAFVNCIGLKKIVIPAEVKKIGASAFWKCKNLKKVTLKTTKLTSKTVGKKAFKGIHKKATVKVPKKALKVYKKMMKSKGFSGKIK